MKQFVKHILPVLALWAALSCTQQNPDAPAVKMRAVSFCPGVEDTESRTVLDGNTVQWEAGDAICVWDGVQQNKFVRSSGASFTGEIAEEPTALYAYYPELEVNTDTQAVLKTSDETPTFTTFLPSFQRLRPNSVSQGALMTACKPTLDGDNLYGQMQILCSFIKFTIGDAENSKVTKVRFTGLSGKFLSGRCNLVFGDTSIDLETLSENNYVECAPASGACFQNGTYYVTTLPYNHQGFTISVTTEDGKVYEYTKTGWVKLFKNQVVYVGQVDSKIATAGGLTEKYSILVDFINNTGITGVPASAGTATMSVPVNETSYDFPIKGLYGTVGNYLTFNGGSTKDAYVETPALEGKTLKEAVVTWIGYKGGNGNAVWIKDASANYSGKYFTNKAIDGTTKKTYAIPVIGGNNSYPFRVSHVFVLGTNSRGESAQQSLGTPAANASYKIWQGDQINSRVEQIQLIYE